MLISQQNKFKGVYPHAVKAEECIIVPQATSKAEELFNLQGRWQHDDVILNDFALKSWNWIKSLHELITKHSS